MTAYISMCDERCYDRISHEKLSANSLWKSKQKRNNESSEGCAHPVTCIICGKPRRLHGHCRSGTSGRACIHERQIQIRERVRERLLTQQSTGHYRMTTKAFHTRGKINSCRRWRWWSGVGVCPSMGCNCVGVCVCVSGQQISDLQMKQLRCLTNFTIDVILQIAILATRTTRDKDPRPRAWAGIVKLKCFEFIQE